jgi:hypothetical protein
MATVIDLRDDPMVDLRIAQTIGQNAGDALARITRQRRRNHTEREIVRIMSNPKLTPEQKLQQLWGVPNFVNTQIGQEYLQMQLAVGRYHETEFDRRYKAARLANAERLAGTGPQAAQQAALAAQKAARDDFKYWNGLAQTTGSVLKSYQGKLDSGDIPKADPTYVAKLEAGIARAEGEAEKAWKRYERLRATSAAGVSSPGVTGPPIPNAAELANRPDPVPLGAIPEGSVQNTLSPEQLEVADPGVTGPPVPADIERRRGPGTFADVIDRSPTLRGAYPPIDPAMPEATRRALAGPDQPEQGRDIRVGGPSRQPRTSSPTFGYGPPPRTRTSTVQAKADDKVAREVGLPVDEDRAEKLALARRFLSQGAYARMSDEDKLEVANKMLAKYGITTTIEELKGEEDLPRPTAAQRKKERDAMQAIWEELNEEERETALQAIKQGKTAQEIIDFFEANK